MTTTTGLDLNAIIEKWLQQCGPCDGGLPMGCSCPAEDYRPVMASLVTEIERLRIVVERVEALVKEFGPMNARNADARFGADVLLDALRAALKAGEVS